MAAERLVHCPICSRDLPESAFGICRARKTGRNLYDKECIRAKVNAQRKEIRAYRALRRQYQAQGIDYRIEAFEPKPVSQLSPVEKVRDAIARGSRTQSEIGSETKLGKDEIGDALANLLLWTKQIKTQVIDGTRMYFLNTVEVKQEIKGNKVAVPFFDIARKLGAPRVQGEKRIQRVA